MTASLLGTTVDVKNIWFAKLVFDLRQDLDLYCLLNTNWLEIEQSFGVGGFFPLIRRRVLGGIILGLCKVYEIEGNMYPLNSIDGIMKELKKVNPKPVCNSAIDEFVQGFCESTSAIDGLDLTITKFRNEFGDELKRFKEARDKVIAHSEFAALVSTAPSYDVMEKLFVFAAKFYAVVTNAFLGINPDDLENNRPAQTDLVRLLEQLGIEKVNTELLKD